MNNNTEVWICTRGAEIADGMGHGGSHLKCIIGLHIWLCSFKGCAIATQEMESTHVFPVRVARMYQASPAVHVNGPIHSPLLWMTSVLRMQQ